MTFHDAHPSKLSPCQQPSTPWILPPHRYHPKMARSRGFCPLTKFAAFLRCFHRRKPVASLGFSLSHLVFCLLSRTSPSPLVSRPKGWFSTSSAPFFFNSLPGLKSQRRSANSESPINSCLWLGKSEDDPTGLSQTGPLTASSRSRMTTSDRLRAPQDFSYPCGPEVQHPEVRNPTLDSP